MYNHIAYIAQSKLSSACVTAAPPGKCVCMLGQDMNTHCSLVGSPFYLTPWLELLRLLVDRPVSYYADWLLNYITPIGSSYYAYWLIGLYHMWLKMAAFTSIDNLR